MKASFIAVTFAAGLGPATALASLPATIPSATTGELIHVKTVSNRGVFVYFIAVFVAVGLLFAITAVPGNSAELFPNPSPEELVQVVRWVWEGAFEGPPISRTLNEQ